MTDPTQAAQAAMEAYLMAGDDEESICRGLIQFFVAEDLTLWKHDKKMESHGKASSGSRRMEPRWHRRLNVALRKGQAVPGFPLQKVKGTKDEFELIIAQP